MSRGFAHVPAGSKNLFLAQFQRARRRRSTTGNQIKKKKDPFFGGVFGLGTTLCRSLHEGAKLGELEKSRRA